MYKWLAVYNDGTSLDQFDGSDERLFSDIDQNKLKKFVIYNGSNGIDLDMLTGVFTINGSQISIDKRSNLDSDNRLIFFKRVRVDIGTTTIDENKTTRYFIGYQTTVDGVNKKVMLSVMEDDFSFHIE